MFRDRTQPPQPTFDRKRTIPVIRSSICTGERVAGFKDKATGRFTDVMLLRTDADLWEFLATYGIEAEEVKKEW